ncbi:MAG: DUF4258 domain-containing protein [Methanothrix sp.]|uniref:hypothetical protein n=1 Tax=Methanothrix sp. TaxID=90426 RepID=UPI0019C70809|nr:hypothetical protein [Methanothrix sp.]MBC7078966.1 DUF4258 domain-containing protein [Methanothrix sp.]NPU87125.1 DUF4258 domain-containing protein [Methanothrix sp.]
MSTIIKSIDTKRGMLFEVEAGGKAVRIMLTWHALEGACDYNTSANDLLNFLIHPDEVIRGHGDRFIAHKRLNRHLARVVYEYENGSIVVVTFYIAYAERYFKGGMYEDKILP